MTSGIYLRGGFPPNSCIVGRPACLGTCCDARSVLLAFELRNYVVGFPGSVAVFMASGFAADYSVQTSFGLAPFDLPSALRASACEFILGESPNTTAIGEPAWRWAVSPWAVPSVGYMGGGRQVVLCDASRDVCFRIDSASAFAFGLSATIAWALGRKSLRAISLEVPGIDASPV